ncbi:MAG: SAM-dependent methyltransferase [Caulobacteraceae bacterium]|nr:SAM-dependent methyltransferase [Caulobacter sp.]
MSLRRRLEAEIAAEGPITVARYMELCLHDPQGGYYATRPALGAEGDFVTAPLLSQMFGELLGLWCAQAWAALGAPSPVRWIELGPGDGTLMADMRRACGRAAPGFLAATETVLVETSAPLRAAQAQRLAGEDVRWAASLAQAAGDAPFVLVANELLDCLPARQFVRVMRGRDVPPSGAPRRVSPGDNVDAAAAGAPPLGELWAQPAEEGTWTERRVGLNAGGELAFGLAPAPVGFAPPPGLESTPFGVVVEVSPAQAALGAEIGARVARQGGAALLIDYGRDHAEPGDTLQALRRHAKVDPLATPGEADLTVHADFPAVTAAARAGGAATSLTTQGAFLQALGAEARAGALARARPDRAEVIARQLRRLIDPEGMGTLFKALAIHPPGVPPPGFPPETA